MTNDETTNLINNNNITNSESIENIEVIKDKMDKYLKASIPVHIVLKIKKGRRANIDGGLMPIFYNGYIRGKKSDDVYMFDDRKLGETYILVDEVFSVTVYSKSNTTLIEEVKKSSGYKKGEGVSDDEIDLIKDFKKMI